MSQIHTCKVFNLNGRRISLTAGVKAGTPVVVLGVELSNHPALRDLAIDYIMSNIDRAIAFVELATEEVAARGMADCDARFGAFISSVAASFEDQCSPVAPSRLNLFKERQ
ncbi:TPA: hypothetical protein ACGFAK_005048 [Serratia marcescens]|uniref:hypothetical protein n=1 Tax=Serratia TaxID=613 RepID=UPI001021A39B|nr:MULTISPECIES: hypothetical protein [Serratia]MBP1133563.1 hypothetical protein [Serratia sp. PL17]HBL7242004.1 hypothetical protein [Serratia liquefaciens]HDS5480617.1 hypothetical protein [Serratia liquefaciens]